MNNEPTTCPYCHSSAGCEHLLLLVDTTFRTAVGGPLMGDFNKQWSKLCEAGGDDFDEREPFQYLLDCVDCYANASNEYDFEGGPGQSSSYIAYFVDPGKDIGQIIEAFRGNAPTITVSSA